MAYATDAERKEVVDSVCDFNACPFVVRFAKGERESELIADDIDHALTLQKTWIDLGSHYVEIFRVNETDGSLITTIGPYFKAVKL